MASEPIDEAFVEISPDLKNFDREMRQGLDKSFDRLENKLDDVVDVIERQFNELISVLHTHFEALEDKADRSFEHVEKSARGAGRAIARDIDVGTKVAKHEIDDLADNAHHDFNRIERDARGSGFSIGKAFSSIGKMIGNVFSGLASTVSDVGAKIGSSLGSTIGQVGSSIGTVTGGIGSIGQIAVYATLIPVVIGLVGALIQLSGALFAIPAAVGVAGAAFAPLIIGFKGVAEAIGAGLSGDTEAFNEALKGLAPNARKVVKEFVTLGPALKSIKSIVQNNLFGPIVGSIAPLAQKLLPMLGAGLGKVATELGKVISGFVELISSNDVMEDISNVFDSTVKIIARFGPSIIDLFGVFFGIMEKGLPWVEKLFGSFSDGIDSVTGWLSKIQQNGQLNTWLEKAWSIGKDLWEVLKQLGIFAGALFGSFGDESQDTLKGMADQLKRVNEYLASDKGQETLHNLGVLIHWAGNALVFLIGATTKAYSALNALFNFIRGIGPFFSKLGTWFSNTWNSIVEWTKSAWHTVQDTVIAGWNGILNYLSSVWAYVKALFVNGWNATVDTVTNFVVRVKNAIMAFPGVVKQFITDAVHNMAYTVGFVIGSVIKWFLDLPGRVMIAMVWLKDGLISVWTGIVSFFTETIPALAVNVGNWFADMWTRALNATVSLVTSILSWIGELPGRVWAYILHLRDLVVGTFNELKSAVVQKVKDLVNGAKEEAKKLPGQVEDAIKGVISKAKDLGSDMVHGMVDGIKAAAHWLWDAARNVVMDALQGAKDAIGVKSPSKAWAEMGKMSVLGYAQGFDAYDLSGQIASSIKMPLDKFAGKMNQTPTVNNSVSVGGASVIAYLQIGDDQLHPVVVRTVQEHPQEVALAAQQGDTQLSRRR